MGATGQCRVTVSKTVVVCVLLPSTPVTVIVYLPGNARLRSSVRVELPPAVTELGLSEAAILFDTPDTARFTVSAAPATTAVPMVLVTVVRRAALSVAGVAVMEKSGTTAAAMVRDTVMLWVADPSCPVTVTT